MSSEAPTPPGGGLARHRSVARRVVPITFVVLAVAAIVLTLPIGPASSGRFDHRYASVPVAGVLPFGSSISAVPASNLLLGVRVTSLALLDEALPFGVVTRVGNTFTLHQPVLVANGGSLDVSGPGELVLAGGSYIEIGPGGSGHLAGLTIRGAPSPSARGFLLDVAGTLMLDHDTIESLGRLATLAEGVTFEAAAGRSGVRDSTITGNTTGVYVTASRGIQIVDDTITHSQLDGVELHGDVTRTVLTGDTIGQSGVHDVELSAAVTRALVVHDTFGPAQQHGVVLYNGANENEIASNTITGTFDGVLLDYVSRNLVEANVIRGVQRFGIRLTGTSERNVLRGNRLVGCPVGVYATSGATRNLVVGTAFEGDAENVRLRLSAPGNVVVPPPTNSELRSL